MKHVFKRSIPVALFIFFTSIVADGQYLVTKFEGGINIGAFIYQGDLTPTRLGSFKTPGINMNLFVNRIINSTFSVRANLAIGELKGDESKYSYPAYRQQRNFKFHTPVYELSGLFVWDIMGKNYDSRKNSGFRPYVFGGAGLTFLNISRDTSHFNSEYFAATDLPARLALDMNHALPDVIPVIPVGAGIRYSITQRLSVNVESTYRFTFTDYLDGFSKAANPYKNDHYQNYSVGIIYSFGKTNPLNCPIIRN